MPIYGCYKVLHYGYKVLHITYGVLKTNMKAQKQQFFKIVYKTVEFLRLVPCICYQKIQLKKPKPHDVEGSYVTFNPLVMKDDSVISIYNRIISPYSYGFIAPFSWCVMRYARCL